MRYDNLRQLRRARDKSLARYDKSQGSGLGLNSVGPCVMASFPIPLGKQFLNPYTPQERSMVFQCLVRCRQMAAIPANATNCDVLRCRRKIVTLQAFFEVAAPARDFGLWVVQIRERAHMPSSGWLQCGEERSCTKDWRSCRKSAKSLLMSPDNPPNSTPQSPNSKPPSQKIPGEEGKTCSSPLRLQISPDRHPLDPWLILRRDGSSSPERRSSLILQSVINLSHSEESSIRPVQTRYFSTLQAHGPLPPSSGTDGRRTPPKP